MTKTLTKTIALTVNGDRLNQTLQETLASIGKQPDNTIKRIAFSPEDIQARQQLHRTGWNPLA